jgi:Uncharacterized conserved protein (DUF2203)
VVHALGPNEFPSADNDGLLQGTGFSLETANRMLPLVRSIVEEIVALNRLIQTQREQLRGIQERLGLPRADLYGEEVQDVRNSLRTDNRRLNDCIRERKRWECGCIVPLMARSISPVESNNAMSFGAGRLGTSPSTAGVTEFRQAPTSKRRSNRSKSPPQLSTVLASPRF